ncbi:MAG: GntR family transcriptional regulator [Bacilli bacterium]
MQENLPRYVKIAHDICSKILSGEFKEGDIIKGRSLLASTYNVSPETIRKAITILANEGIVEVKQGVGIFVDSVIKAKQYADKWDAQSSIDEQYNKVTTLIEEANKLNIKLQEALNTMIDNFKYQTNETINFQKATIPQGCWLNNKTIGEVYFWNYTEATIVAVVSNGNIQTSPGPDYPLKEGDTLILVGKDEVSYDRVLSFITYGIEE